MNKGFYPFTITILCFLFITPLSSQTPTVGFATWKDNKKAAYSIIHDDYASYVPGIFRDAYPIAKARGIKICFGAITGFCEPNDWANARTMIADGNECVNHSHNHRCGGTAGQCSGLTSYGAADFATELDLSTQLIETNAQVRPRFFIHPYDAPSTPVLNHLQGLGYLGTRAGAQGIVNSSNFTNFMTVNFFVYDGTAAALASLNTAVDAAISSNGYAIREFHGVDDGSWAAMTVPNYTNHLNYVKSKMDDGSIWSATTTEAITYKMQRDAFQPTVAYSAASNILTVSFASIKTIDPSVLRTPVTVNVNLNGITGNYIAKQNNAAVTTTRNGNIISFNVYPHQGAVTLECTDCVVTPPAQPVDVTNLAATPQQTSVGLTWANPAAFDEIRVVAQTTPITGTATNYTTTGDFTTGKIVYSSTGSSVSVTGLTAGTLYYFKTFTRLGSLWSSGVSVSTTTTAIPPPAQPVDVTNLAATPQQTSVGLTWTNPAAFDEIRVVVQTTPITGTATNYTTTGDFTAGKIVYSSIGSSVSVTGLTAGTLYYFKTFTRLGSLWSSGVSVSTTTTAVPPPAQPVDVTNLAATPQQTSAGLTWTNPAAFDEIRVVVQTTPITGTATNYTTTGDFTAGKIVYSSIGSSVSVTGLTAGTLYYFKTFTRLGSLWSNGVSVSITTTAVTPPSQPSNILNFVATPQTNAATLAWTNPTTNFDEIMIVAKPLTGFISIPSGTAYTANANFTGAGTTFEGGKVVYKGIGTSVNITNLAGGTLYYFRAYSRLGTTWSTGIEINATPTSPAVITPIPGCLQASYFTNVNLTGTPTLVRGEAKIDNDWAAAVPATGIPADNFSVRWEGTVNPPVTGTYVFTVTVDDGVRLWINNVQVINKWIDQGSTTYTTNVVLTQGQAIPIKMEYYERTGSAVAKLAWTIPTLTSQPIIFNATCAIVQPPVAAFNASKCYRIDARHSNRPLQLPSRSTANGLKIEQGSWSNSRSEMWRIKTIDATYYHITSVFSGKYVTVANNLTTDGASIIQNPLVANGANQMFKFDKNATGQYVITAKHSGKVFDISGGSTLSGASLIQWAPTNGTNQQFNISETTCPLNSAALESSKIVAFDGKYDNGKALLQWVVKSEDLMDYFDIEKANEAGEFKSIKVMNGTSASELREFSYSDENLVNGDNYYRLTTVASDGSSQTSQIVKVKYTKSDAYAVYPNPANDYFSLDLSTVDGQPVDIAIMDAVGKIVKTAHIDSAPLSQRFEIGELENGQYFVRIQSKGKKMIIKKLMIIK